MNCHQILSGACNAGDRCFAIGSVEGVPFTSYAAGCNIVILASNFERVQIIPGAIHNNIRISAIDCSTDTGKIAAAYDDTVCIFEPTPLVHNEASPSHGLEYRWVQTGTLHAESKISSLSWNLEGTRLLTASTTIQLWHEKISNNENGEPTGVTFEIGGDPRTPTSEDAGSDVEWECVWKCKTATPVHHMAFSPDGTLFATSGKSDRLVKVWYENKQLLFPNKSAESFDFNSLRSMQQQEFNYGFVYVAHPRAVTRISWRKTSKYMPKGSVSNILVTSCMDNICRIWIETILPDDGLVNMNQFDPIASQNPKFRTHRHKHRFMQRLKHMKTCFHIRRHIKHNTVGDLNGFGGTVGGFMNRTGSMGQAPIPTLPSTYSVHDFHSYGYHGTGVTPGLHFHLAASINAETDIPLVPSMKTNDPANQPNFIVHWLNNKEMFFSLQAEVILQELTKKVLEKEQMANDNNSTHNNFENKCENKAQSFTDGDTHHSGSKTKLGRNQKTFSYEDSNSEDHPPISATHPSGFGNASHISMSNATSVNSFAGEQHIHATDSLDTKIEALLRDWHHSPDLLFSIHPIDGSFLIWVVEWLDEFHPGSFRQAQISFSTRIPSAFSIGDALSMSTSISLYNSSGNILPFKEMVKGAKLVADLMNPAEGSENVDGSQQLASVIEESEAEGETTNEDGEENDDNENDENIDNSIGKREPAKTKHEILLESQDMLSSEYSPTISMVTKHANGTLNLWQLTFAEKTKFTQVLSIGHVCRASGHRFRVNDITCHPVLPLLLTTSHHNIPDKTSDPDAKINDISGFCSELILWRVDAVGPLSQSGGISELARINSLEISAFSNVAWIPTLLPSTTLGSLSNSPSACFVASDGECLRVYQAVIDARTLLAQISLSERKSRLNQSMASLSTDCSSDTGLPPYAFHEKIKIVSQQSTARPGCIIQLDAIADASHDWQNTQFLHVFQEQLITGRKFITNESDSVNISDTQMNSNSFLESQMSAMVDLQRSAIFEEPFYIVIVEKTNSGSTIHMWRIVIASQPQTFCGDFTDGMMYVPDSSIVQDIEEGEQGRRYSMFAKPNPAMLDIPQLPHIAIQTTKVCTQELPLPDGVDVIHASPAAGHLSSSSIYPACFAPYVIVTACSDSTLRFWKCRVSDTDNPDEFRYEWNEWEMLNRNKDSSIEIQGQPLHISAAFSGRIACAYKYGKSFTRPHKGDSESRYVNLCVAIYECESTGGSEWLLEDRIYLKNIHLPRILHPNLDLSFLHDSKFFQKKQKLTQALQQTLSHDDTRSTVKTSSDGSYDSLQKAGTSLLAVPSFSTLQSLRKSITENGNTCPLTQKHLVQIDWVSKEDGSHILTVAVGSKVLLYTLVSSDIAQANMKAMKESQSTNRPLLRKASSLAQTHFCDEIRWMKLRQIELETADSLPPLPMQMSWVRDGILVVGMDSEMHVYTQWRPNQEAIVDMEDMTDTRNLRDEDLKSLAFESSQRRLANVSSMPALSRISTMNLLAKAKDKRGGSSTGQMSLQVKDTQIQDYMPDFGLFEASRIACPVLPQYHPKQLMELLNSGKIRWVKAILAHLVKCISGVYSMRGYTNDDSFNKQRGWSRSRTLSVSYPPGAASPLEQRGSTTQITEELTLDYDELTSIPPLPLWTLLAADNEASGQYNSASEDGKDYNKLFDVNVDNDESLDDLLEDKTDSLGGRERRPSIPEKQSFSLFGLRQAQLLSQVLTHTHLPGLSSLDQMHLLALADTVATCNSDLAERFANDAAKNANARDNITCDPDTTNISIDSLDDCGLRYLLAMKQYSYLLRCLPINQRTMFQKQGVGSSNICWGFHSESEDELLSLIPSYGKDQMKWGTMRDLGVGWWLQNQTGLKTFVERLAKAAYQAKQDPLDAAMYYFAMKKKSIVWGLYRSQRDEKMTEFFSHNFTEERWRKAAFNNAYKLLSKHRFEHAVAFFLLANSLSDAIKVCLSRLEDLQLALVLARLYEGELESYPPTYRKLLNEEILGWDSTANCYDNSKAHPDPFYRSMALWILKDYIGSLNTLLLNDVGFNHPLYQNDDTPRNQGTNPNVFNFYIYLRTHPLLIRQYIASTAQESKKTQVFLSGFSYSSDANAIRQSDKQLQVEDSITPLERQLYFTTAHGHFKSGCPALALEVLSKLPTKVIDQDLSDMSSTTSEQNIQIETGTLTSFNLNGNAKEETADAFDWGSSALSMSMPVEEELKLDFGNDDDDDEGVSEEEENGGLNFKFDKPADNDDKKLNQNDGSDPLDIMAQQLKFVACLKILMEELSTLATGFEVDGGQLRYQLYVWLEKEVEALKYFCNYRNGETTVTKAIEEINQIHLQDFPQPRQERPSLRDILLQETQDFEAKVQRASKRKQWLKENETLLRTLLSYCSLHGASGGGLASVRMELVLLLQELQQEKTQQQLMSPLPFPTTLPLLSACVAGNKIVTADPIKVLQSLTNDMMQTIINFNAPPVALKVCSASEIFILRDLAVALSACIYQSLCDSDTFIVKQVNEGCCSPGIENLARLNATYQSSYLMSNANALPRRRRFSTDDQAPITTSPSKWPGVQNLIALIAREKDDDIPRLNVLLCESFVGIFVSLFVYGIAACDCHILYRLCGQRFSNQTWATLYGGGVKKLLRRGTTRQSTLNLSSTQPEQNTSQDENGGEQTRTVIDDLRHRVKLNMRILGHFSNTTASPNILEDRATYREQFISPEMSMVSYVLIKPTDDANEDDYDSADSIHSEEEEEDDEDVFGDPLNDNIKPGVQNIIKKRNSDNIEHSDCNSYSWIIMRYALLRLTQQQLQEFINIAGIEMQELPVSSPLIHGILKTLSKWEDMTQKELESKLPLPADFIPGCFTETDVKGPAIQKYRTLLEKQNTPFSTQSAAAPARRLWNYLVRQEVVQEIFIRAIFGKPKSSIKYDSDRGSSMSSHHTKDLGSPDDDISTTDVDNHQPNVLEPVRIIHKDQEQISAFCLNLVNPGLLALATPREVQELDISLLLESPNWLEDECDIDLMNLTRDPDTLPTSGFLVIQTQTDKHLHASTNVNNYGQPMSPQAGIAGQSGRGSSMIKGLTFPGCQDPRFCKLIVERSKHYLKPVLKHKIDNVKRMCAHPLMSLYLTGSQDGSVHMWEWSHQQAVCNPRAPGTFAKVTRCRFSQHGNKFGIADGDGNLSLWQAGLASQSNRSFYTHQCHPRGIADFVFLGSCSLLATAGHSSENKNVGIWDTLLPQAKSLVASFTCHDQGASSIVYAPQHQLLISAGKKGDVCIYDVRQRVLKHRFQAHESPIKCLAIDPNEEYFVTGSADGDIKVWALTIHKALYSFMGEHSKNRFFKHMAGQGVTQLQMDSNNRLFSCGSDGSMKVRQLPERDAVVHTLY